MPQVTLQKPISHQHFELTYADSRAKAVWQRALSAFDRSLPLDFVVTGSSGTYRILMDKDRIRQDGEKASIVYRAGKIWVKSSSGKRSFADPKSSLSKLASKVGMALDPAARAWSFEVNPMAQLVSPGAKARLNGNLLMGGISCDLLEIASPGLKMNLVLRHKDGLPLRVFSELRDDKGLLMSTSERKFGYVSIHKPISAKRFEL